MAYHRSFYGLGYVTAIPSGSNPTPSNLAIVRSATVEVKTTEKPLMGNYLFPLDVATSSGSITGKITTADFDARLLGLVIPGTSTSSGVTRATTSAATTIPTTPFQITPTVPSSGTWAKNFEVVNLTNQLRMTVGATATGTGVYAVSAGVYTFHADDVGDSVAISYGYTVAATGTTLTSTNQSSGATSGFQLYLFDPAGGSRENGLYFPQVKFLSVSLGMKQDDWTETSIDWQAYADSSGNVCYTYGAE